MPDRRISELPAIVTPAALDIFPGVQSGQNFSWRTDQILRSPVDIYNVIHYGAVRNGVTDDTQAIQDAIDAASAAGGGIVFVPRGIYIVSRIGAVPALEIPSNVFLMGAGRGATIIQLADADAQTTEVIGTEVGATRCMIADLTVDGNNVGGATGFGINLNTATLSVIARCRVTQTRSHGINVNTNAHENWIVDNEVDNWGPGVGTSGFGILLFEGCERNTVRDNKLNGGANSDIGIGVDASTMGGGGVACLDNDVLNNTVIDCVTGIGIEDSHRTLVEGNLCSGQSSVGIIVREAQDDRDSLDNKILNNTVKDTGAGTTGISIQGSGTLVHGNTVRDLGANSNGIKIPTGIIAVSEVTISENRVTGFTGSGIQIENGTRIKIIDNTVTNLVNGRGIYILGIDPISFLEIRENTVFDIDSAAGGRSGIYVINQGSAISNVQVSENTVYNIGVSGNQEGIAFNQVAQTISGVRVFRNRITDIQGASTLSNGVGVSGTISDFKAFDNHIDNYITDAYRFATVTGPAMDVFTDGDTTPTVGGRKEFKTGNTGATIITFFDDGVSSQKVTIIFDDALTTIDFTGTNLKGNGGADWNPAPDDSMICVFDGTDWFCDISDNT